MKQNGRFMVGLVGVALVVTWLVWTGVSETMVYYLTPEELIARVEADPTFHEVGIKVSGRLLPDSYEDGGSMVHRFVVHDIEDESIQFPVEYHGLLPDTFTDAPDMLVDVVLEGRYLASGTFEATTVLTKCGSRYEATPEALAAG